MLIALAIRATCETHGFIEVLEGVGGFARQHSNFGRREFHFNSSESDDSGLRVRDCAIEPSRSKPKVLTSGSGLALTRTTIAW